MGGENPVGWEKSQSIRKMLENSIKTNIDSRGRVYIPKKYRDQLKINANETLFAILQDNGILFLTPKEYVKKIAFETDNKKD